MAPYLLRKTFGTLSYLFIIVCFDVYYHRLKFCPRVWNHPVCIFLQLTQNMIAYNLKWKDILKQWLREAHLKAVGQGNICILFKKTFQKEMLLMVLKGLAYFPPNKKDVQHRILTTESNDFSEAGSSISPSSNITVGPL